MHKFHFITEYFFVFFPEYSRLYGLKHEVNFKVKIKINKVGKMLNVGNFELKN